MYGWSPVHCFYGWATPPLRPPCVYLTSCTGWMSTAFSLFFAAIPFSCIYWTQTKEKNEGGLGTVFVNWFHHSLYAAMAVCVIITYLTYAKLQFSKSSSLLQLSLFNNNNSKLVLVLTACDFNKNKDGYLTAHRHSHLTPWPKLHVASNNHRKERI